MRFYVLAIALAFVPRISFADDQDYTVIVVGGAGGDTSTPTLQRLTARLHSLDADHAAVVFTGNYAKSELPPQGDKGRAEAESAILAHVQAVQDFAARGGKVYFLPGHHDFASHGARAVRRLRDFLNRSFAASLTTAAASQTAASQAAASQAAASQTAASQTAASQTAEDGDDESQEVEPPDVMPVANCADMTPIELTKDLGLVLVNSEWWMQDWANDPDANQGCEVKTRASFDETLIEALRAYRHRRLIIASHHPLRSNGPYGGSFTGFEHVLPIPILGTAWVLARQLGLVPEYQNHPLVRSYIDLMLQEAQRNGAYVFVSGHDQDLQYLHVEKQAQIISGSSGRTATATVTAAPGDFAKSTPGWVELVVQKSGEGDARFFAGDSGTQLFQAALPAIIPTGKVESAAPPPFPEGQVSSHYTKQHVWHFSPFVKFFIGSYYSDAYEIEMPYNTLNFELEQGGLKPKGVGGGLQTNSLKLKDENGGQWALRAVAKDSTRVLPWPQNQATFINRLLDHGYTATHPEAALTMASLAQALGVLHSTPRMFYVPDQEGMGEYRGYMSNEVASLEQKPKAKKGLELPQEMVGTGEGKVKIKDSPETFAKIFERPDKYRLDEEAMARARLLDVLAGDWDRHAGQWAFAEREDADGVKVFRPIPRDRDQALANYDGLGLWLARIVSPDVRRMQPFGSDFGSITWMNYNARMADAFWLNGVTHERMMAIARDMQKILTDEVIDQSFANWHKAAYELDGKRIAAALKVRRDHLLEAAEKYYTLVNRVVDVFGSDHDDRFDLYFLPDGNVRVVSHIKHKKDKERPPFFDRTFVAAETHELNIYALGGDDTLHVHGNSHTTMTVRFVGGSGKDTVRAAEDDGRTVLAPALEFYDTTLDTEDGGTIDKSVRVTDERSRHAERNQYDSTENHDPDFGIFFPSLAINPDDGAFIGGTYTYTVQGFKKHPFASSHAFSAAVATATGGIITTYRAIFPNSVSVLDQQIDLALKTPNYSRNFFGITNQVVRDPDHGHLPGSAIPAHDNYYRLRQADYEARYGLSYGFHDIRSRVGAQLIGQILDTEDTAGRFVRVSPDVSADAIGARYWGGAKIFASTNTFDDLVLPKRGVALNASVEGRYDLARLRELSTTFKGGAAVAFPFDPKRRFVLTSRLIVEGIVGDHPFYFSPTLGGYELRAYHYQQFAGDFAFAQSTDLRIDFLQIVTGIPSDVGLTLSIDHGRVFGKPISGNDYHMDYGGGLWWSVLDYIGLQFAYYRSLEGTDRFVFTAGPLFAQTTGF